MRWVLELAELLLEFRREDLCQAVIDMRTHVSLEAPRYEDWSNQTLHFGITSGRPTKNELIGNGIHS